MLTREAKVNVPQLRVQDGAAGALQLPLIAQDFRFTPIPAVSAGSGAAASASAATDGISDAIEEMREVYKSLFSEDAKLLGVVCLKDVMKFLDAENIEPPDQGMPELAEKIRYGAGAVEDAAGSAVELVRGSVLVPLKNGTDEIRSGWNRLEADLAAAQSNLPGVANPNISIAQALPELDRALDGLSLALDASLAETDSIAFTLSLGAVYEAGRRFIDAVAAAAANPARTRHRRAATELHRTPRTVRTAEVAGRECVPAGRSTTHHRFRGWRGGRSDQGPSQKILQAG
jgi:hypothetical protein